MQSSRTFIRLSQKKKKLHYENIIVYWTFNDFRVHSSDYLGLSQKKKKLHYENIIVYWEESSKVK